MELDVFIVNQSAQQTAFNNCASLLVSNKNDIQL